METISRNLEELLAFHIVATEGSFTKAAETLGTSKAMVSKQVKRLESYMSATLFHRTTRTLTLTENGTALLSYSSKIIDLSNEASKRLRDVSQGSSGLMRISAPVSLGDLIFPSLIPAIKLALPEVLIELDLSNENRDFSKDNVDFALRATEVQHPDLIVRNLGRIKDVICASARFLKKANVDKDPSKLGRYECILHSQEEDWNDWTFNSPGGDIRVKAKGTTSTNQ
jgi:DNA-binding transcriptional LysR family regulator